MGAKISPQSSGTHIDSLITLWNSYNRTGQHDLTIQSARPIAIKAMREADSVTAIYAGIFTAQSFLFTENEVDSAKYYADMISRYVKTSGEPSLMINFDNIMGSYHWSIIWTGWPARKHMVPHKAVSSCWPI